MACGGLLATVGCGQAPKSEPKKLETVVNEKARDVVSPAKTAAEPVAVEPAPVQQVKFEEAINPATTGPAIVPPVLMTTRHKALCRVFVGDTLPEIELPKVLGGTAKLSALYGKAATVVVFWKGNRQMALDELADLGPDIVQQFGSRGVEVVAIAVGESAGDARSIVQKSAANYPQLVDADGKAFAKVGSVKLPRTFVLDASGKIVYFDLEYSLATRRELQQAVLAMTR